MTWSLARLNKFSLCPLCISLHCKSEGKDILSRNMLTMNQNVNVCISLHGNMHSVCLYFWVFLPVFMSSEVAHILFWGLILGSITQGNWANSCMGDLSSRHCKLHVTIICKFLWYLVIWRQSHPTHKCMSGVCSWNVIIITSLCHCTTYKGYLKDTGWTSVHLGFRVKKGPRLSFFVVLSFFMTMTAISTGIARFLVVGQIIAMANPHRY